MILASEACVVNMTERDDRSIEVVVFWPVCERPANRARLRCPPGTDYYRATSQFAAKRGLKIAGWHWTN